MAQGLLYAPGEAERKRKLAATLFASAVTPPDIQRGDPPAKSWLPLIQALGGLKMRREAQRDDETRQAEIGKVLGEATAPVPLEGPAMPGQPSPSRPKNLDELAQALSGSKYTQEAGLQLQMQAMLAKQKAEAEAAARRQGVEDDISKMIDPRVVAAKKEIAGAGRNAPPRGYRFNDSGELEPVPGGPKSSLPAPALKLQQEELDALGTAASLKSDLAGLRGQLEAGEIELGPVSNLIAQGRNILGKSTEQSKKFASLKATLERMRNDSLRLNKGVQTEGDAQRAWNELIANINDPGVVAQRLSEIEQLNDRAVNFRKMNLDAIRSNYGLPSMDTQGYTSQPSPYKKPETTPAAPAGGVKFLGFE